MISSIYIFNREVKLTRIYNLELQKMKKDNDKYLEENKDELNKAALRRGCKIDVKIDKLEYYHGSYTEMNMDDYTYRYFEPKGKSTIEGGINFLQGKIIRDNLTVLDDCSTTQDGYIDTKVDILLNVYDKEQPKLGCLGSYSLYNYSEGRKKIIFDLDIPKETYAYIDKARSGNDEFEFFAQVEAPKKDEVEYVVPVGRKPDIEGKVYRSVFRSLHSFTKK